MKEITEDFKIERFSLLLLKNNLFGDLKLIAIISIV